MLVYDIIPLTSEKAKKAVFSSALVALSLFTIFSVAFFFSAHPQETSAASGDVIVLWDGASIPSGWTCISCATGDPFFGAFPMGSSTYANATSGSDTAAPAASFVSESTGAAVGISANGSTYSSPTHTHDVPSGNISVSPSDIRPPYQDLELISAPTTTLPNGAIGIFDTSSSSLPANWSYYSAMAGKYLRAAGDAAAGGAATSTNALTATTAAETSTPVGGHTNGGTSVSVAVAGHTHTISGNIQPASDTPPYINVVFAQLTATSSIPTGMIAMFDAALPAGWTSVSGAGQDFNGRFLQGSDSYGATGGFSSVVHPTTTIASGAPSATATTRSGSTAQVSSGAHTHNFTFSFSAESIIPVNRSVIFAKRQPTVTAGSAGTQIATTSVPSSGFYVGGAFTLVRDSGSANVTQIVVTASGTVSASANLSNLLLYYQTAATCATSSIPVGATQFNSAGASFNGSEQATATGTISVGTSQICVYAKVDIGSGASGGQNFQFEIADPLTDFTVDSGNVGPSSPVAISGSTALQTPMTTVGSAGTQKASTTIPKTGFYLGGSFTFVRNSGSANITQIMITASGTVDANANVSNLKLYYEQASTCATSSIPVGVTAFNATGGSFNASGQSTVTGSMPVGTSQICVYAQVDIGSGANDGDTIDLEITDPETDVIADAGSVAPSTAVAIAGTTTLQAPTSILIEHDFQVYENVDAVQPVTALAPENASATDIAQGQVIRLRFNIISSGGPLATSSQAFQLQYASMSGFTACVDIPSGNFADIGAAGSSTIWRGFNNTSTADGATLTATLLPSSTVAESYVEQGLSSVNPNRIPTNGIGEWDFVIENNGATNSTGYCFRVVRSGGSVFAQYDNLPQVEVVRPLFEVHYRWRNDDGGE